MFAEHAPSLFGRLAPKAAETFVDADGEQPRPDNLFVFVVPARRDRRIRPGGASVSIPRRGCIRDWRRSRSVR
ncbi:hypothetical protein AB5I41_25805 [Sphingomonas sp. MMS24-JH45]